MAAVKSELPRRCRYSFGITMGTNIGFGVVKEFIPDMVRPFANKRKR
jgi:hypothetical protein